MPFRFRLLQPSLIGKRQRRRECGLRGRTAPESKNRAGIAAHPVARSDTSSLRGTRLPSWDAPPAPAMGRDRRYGDPAVPDSQDRGLRRLSGFPQFADLAHPAQTIRDHTSGIEEKHRQCRDQPLQNEAYFHVPVLLWTPFIANWALCGLVTASIY